MATLLQVSLGRGTLEWVRLWEIRHKTNVNEWPKMLATLSMQQALQITDTCTSPLIISCLSPRHVLSTRYLSGYVFISWSINCRFRQCPQIGRHTEYRTK